jgi:hypothetical protein
MIEGCLLDAVVVVDLQAVAFPRHRH